MPNINSIRTETPRPDAAAILWRVAWPLLVFSAALALLFSLSWALLLPRFARIEVGGKLQSIAEIRTYREALTAQIAAKEEGRRQSVLAVHDPAYDMLKEQRRARLSFDALKGKLTEHAKSVTGKDDAIVFSTFDYDPDGRTLATQGDVRNMGTRSMTMLAAFALSLNKLPFIAEATTPAFTREEDAVFGPHSPFSITLTLRP